MNNTWNVLKLSKVKHYEEEDKHDVVCFKSVIQLRDNQTLPYF